MGHQDTKLTFMRPRLKELNDIPYIYHIEGGSYKVSKTRIATMPSAAQGALLLYGDNRIKRFILLSLIKMEHIIKYLYWKKKIETEWDKADIMSKAHWNTFVSAGSKLSTKEIFCKYYKR